MRLPRGAALTAAWPCRDAAPVPLPDRDPGDYVPPDYPAQYDYPTGQAQSANASERTPLYDYDTNGYYNYDDYEQNNDDYLQDVWNDLLQ